MVVYAREIATHILPVFIDLKAHHKSIPSILGDALPCQVLQKLSLCFLVITPSMVWRSPGQKHFVGTAVEYFPLSFVRDTAISPTISRKDDIHTKQRQGSLPKPIRCNV